MSACLWVAGWGEHPRTRGVAALYHLPLQSENGNCRDLLTHVADDVW